MQSSLNYVQNTALTSVLHMGLSSLTESIQIAQLINDKANISNGSNIEINSITQNSWKCKLNMLLINISDKNPL